MTRTQNIARLVEITGFDLATLRRFSDQEIAARLVVAERDRIRIAHHEAGHAVIARVLTLVAGGATIKPDRDSHGHNILECHFTTEQEWEKRDKVRELDVALHARIIATMAGAETDALLFRRKPVGTEMIVIGLSAWQKHSAARRRGSV